MSPNDEIERLSRSLKSLEPIRLHEEISRVTELSRLASTRIAEVVRVNQQHWQHMIDQTTAVSRMTDLPYIHRTWLRNLKSTQDQAAQLQIALKSTLGPIAARLAVSERLFTDVDVAAICRSIALPELEGATLLAVRHVDSQAAVSIHAPARGACRVVRGSAGLRPRSCSSGKSRELAHSPAIGRSG